MIPAPHKVVGISEVAMTCGNGRCDHQWLQPVFLDERIGTVVCPHCLWATEPTIPHDLLDGYRAASA